jgi:pyrroline-5-carboxylate reductase
MKVGLIGAGNMAAALARGWGEPVLATDPGSGRAAALAAELGGEALDSTAALAERVQPNTPAEVGRGVTLLAEPADQPLDGQVEELFGRVGAVVRVPEGIIDACAACSGVGPAYWALVAEAWVEAGIRRGIPAPIAQRLVTETMAGSAELLRAREHDTLRLRREVTSPGGTTARGLAALERGGVRAAFASAMDDVLGPA